ncbi:MAG: hypothetical protein ACI9XO_000121 [Paraglaciecola sp.]|jgi:hypothetical protein
MICKNHFSSSSPRPRCRRQGGRGFKKLENRKIFELLKIQGIPPFYGICQRTILFTKANFDLAVSGYFYRLAARLNLKWSKNGGFI